MTDPDIDLVREAANETGFNKDDLKALDNLVARLAKAEQERDEARRALRYIAAEEPTVVDADGLLLCLMRQSDIARQALVAPPQEGT